MKAIMYHRYGTPDVLECEETEKPTPEDNHVLIKVRAASVNPLECGVIRGAARFVNGLRKPKITRLGVDVAGEVEEVGRNVTQFRSGDAVFGVCVRNPQASGVGIWSCQGTFAEYVCAHESTLVKKPDNVAFEQAASAPMAAFTALQGLRDKGRIRSGQKVLINGASGGVGTFAVQIAKSFGAEVTGVCSTKNLEIVRSIGADHVIDYTREDFTKSGQHYDVVFDCIVNHSALAIRRVMKPKGICVAVGGPHGHWFGAMFRMLMALFIAFVMSRFTSRKLIIFIARPNRDDLNLMRELMATGKVTPVIDRRYGLTEVPHAIRYLEEGHARGKVVITMPQNDSKR